jgi:hypothetical protein
MEATRTARHLKDDNPPSFETVWAIFEEVGKKQKELTESQKATDRIIGKLGSRMGEVIEYIVLSFFISSVSSTHPKPLNTHA